MAMPIDAQLDTLEAKGLIRLAASRPELEYLFRHWLVQDAAYGSLLKQERRALHRLVGEALEGLYPDRGSELAGVLAIHFAEAGDADKAVDYLIAAGKFAMDRNAIAEAYSAFDRGATLLPPPTDIEDEAWRRRRVEIELGRGRAGWTFRLIDDIISDLEAIVPTAERLGDLDLIAPIHLAAAMGRMGRGEQSSDPEVKRSLDRVAEIGEALHDPSLRALQLAVIGLNQVFTGPIREGVAALEEAVPLLEQRQDFIGAAFARGALAMGYARLGDFDKAEQAAQYATRLAAGGDVIAQLDAQIAESVVRSERGQLDEAIPIARSCVARSEETGATACAVVSSWVLGDIYQRQGRFQEAREALQRGHELALVVDRTFWRPSLQAWLGTSATALGDFAAAEGSWEEPLATARSIGNRFGEAGILWKRAEASAKRGDSAAVADFAASAAILEELGARPQLARVLRGWGEALRAAGRTAESDATLHRALALFEEMGIAPEGEAVRATLAGDAQDAAGG
ncbi:MAG: tetratricopeptide repeat protein [Chloroflexota bacterium]|nr:tetratricopeptide repeat protein [Chloroflexota bacterium]